MNRFSLISLTLAAIAGQGMAAAERPLGALDRVEDRQVVVTFDASVRLDPGTVVAVYGPGAVRKHPLTKEVIVEDRRLIAKAQITGQDGRTYRARLGWSEEGAQLVPGLDVVPLPGEAAPNGAPTSQNLPEISGGAQAAVTVRLPISDPDGDALLFTWSLAGPAGQSGRFDARTTTKPEITWFAPTRAGAIPATVVVRDPYGQETTAQITLTASGSEGDLRNRAPQVLGALGNASRCSRVERDADGGWWAIDQAESRIIRISPGWLRETSVKIGKDNAPVTLAALAAAKGQLYALDPSSRVVHVYNPDGSRVRQLGGLSRPSDVVADPSGTVFVADQSAGGVLVFEANGRFRARLGQEGKGVDAFTGLSRVALGPNGELFCLDAEQRQVQRFDRFQRRLDTWEIQGDVKIAPVDLAWHPRGLLVLMASGQIQIFNEKGLAKEAMAPVPKSFGVDVGAPDALTVDATGEIYVAHAETGVLARYAADGSVTGLRGAPCAAPCVQFSQDATGRTYGLDTRSSEIRAFDSEGFLIGKAGGFARELSDLAVSPDGSVLCALDADKLIVHRLDPAKLNEKPQPIGGKGTNNGQWKEPIKLAVDDAGRIYVLDAGLHRVVVSDREGRFLFNAGRYERGKNADELADPRLLAVAPAGDALYVYDYDRYDVKKFALDQNAKNATHVTNAGGKGDNPGQIRKLSGLGCDRLGLLYALDAGREDVQIFDFRGSNAVTVAVWTMEKVFGLRRPEQLAVLPDGGFLLGGAGSTNVYRW